ncbi:MAG: RNA polymerase sigma factor FliA [Burkholderiales bacterium]|nr:RNA polymerase sigma factor FliA [Burkholderiales bacterium]
MYDSSNEVEVERYVHKFAPLVKRIAHHMMASLPSSVEIDDMIQSGMIGLLDAARRYTETEGAQFETYAVQRIRGAMLDSLRQADWLPRSLRQSLRRIEVTISRLEQAQCRPPTENELAAALNMSLGDYQHLLQEARGYQLVSYEDFKGGEDESFIDRYCSDGRPDPLAFLTDRALREELASAIDDLPEREKRVMGLYYEQELNLREIGEILGVSESRICQLHTQAIARLRTRLREAA